MSIATLILGHSGSGKTTSLRNLDPANTLLIQALRKPLPFRADGWRLRTREHGGNIFQTDNPAHIVAAMHKSREDIIVIDDYQAVMVNQLLSRTGETGYKKFEDIGKAAWDVFNAAGQLAEHRRVYILAHTQTDDFGNVRMKTVGKMVDNTLVPEGYFTIVLKTQVSNGVYQFTTQTNGQDCCKSPIGMFASATIDNDLAAVDQTICDFYGVQSHPEKLAA